MLTGELQEQRWVGARLPDLSSAHLGRDARRFHRRASGAGGAGVCRQLRHRSPSLCGRFHEALLSL